MKRNGRGAEQNSKIALEVLKEQKPVNEVAKEYEVRSVQASKWKRELTMENDWLKKIRALSNEEKKVAKSLRL